MPKKQIEQRLTSIQDVERNIEEYVKYSLFLSKVPEIWVDGVKLLKEILSKHDLSRIKKVDLIFFYFSFLFLYSIFRTRLGLE